MIRSLLFFALTVLSFYSFSQGGVACAEMAPICTDVGLNFTANAGIDQAGTTDPGNDYDCLISQPNPTWYYFQIATDGDIIMELSADQDIDYAIWGPFSTLSVAQSACNSMGDQSPPNPDNGNIVDCSFSPTEVETPIITGAITGEVYVMLITNYAGVVQDIALSQTGGSGSTDCNIVTNPPCSISAFNANPSGCDFTTNTYSVSGVIEYTSAPTAGSLVVEDCNGNTTVVDNFPFAASPQNFSLTGLVSDGLPCDVEVYFTADPTCSQQYNYTAPVCVNNCPAYDLFASSPSEACGNQQYFLEIQNSACDGTVNFEVSGDYGTFPSEISWYVTSNLTGNQVASGSGGAAGGTFNVAVGPIDPNIEGTIFNLVVEDSWGDGFSGGGFIQTEAPDGTVLGGPITGNFGVFSNSYFNSGIIVSSSTITVTTPTGAVTSVVGNCGDHSIPITLQNNNYCTPIVVDLPWMIMCDLTGTLIASGTHSVTVYPQVPTNASDLVSIDWNASTCSWDVTPQNDCDVLDLNVLYSISPDPSSLAAGCSNGTEEFTVTYLGFAEGPDCCSTGGPLIPATYTNNQGTTDFITQTAYGGTNNAAYGTVPGSGIGGNSTAVTIDISGSGYCFPNVPSPPGPPVTGEDDYYVDIYVDGVQIAIYGPLSDPPGSFNYSFTHADLMAAGVTYNQNSVIEVYVLPNQFFDPGPPQINTVYIPGANCNTLAAGEWSASDFSIDVTATYEQFVASPANCTFIVNEPFTCCSTGALSATAPANQDVECIGDVPPSDITLVTNIISECPTTVAFVSDVSDGASCPEVITRTYSVTDDCGNSTTVTQTITVDDITAPTASNPAGIDVECIGDVPAFDVSVVNDAADNCTVSPVVAFVSDVSDGASCPEVITRTYSVTDDCGNSTTVTQTITVDDITAPTASNPAGIDVECIGDVPAFDVSVVNDAADNCTVSPVVAFVSDVSDGASCPEVITRTYSVTDDCGNSTTVTQTITVDDITAPTASNPAGIDVECIGDVPAFDVSVVNDAADNCTVSPVVAFVSDVSDGASCPEVITRTYSVTDDCGNSTTVTQTITVDDITAPTASNPAGIDVECIGDVPAFDVSVVSDAADNCTVSPVVAFVSDVSDGASCPEVITRTYSVTDDCGNSTTVTQTITVNDITAPTASNPTDIVIPIGPAPAPDINQVLDEADNCTVSPVVAFVSDVSDGVECPETITRTYSVTDDCGNQILVTQTIVIGGGNVPEPTVSANGPICEGEDAIFTIEGIIDAVVTYDVGLGSQTTVLTGGISIITVPSAAPPNSTITLSNISDESCSSVLNLTATTIVNPPALPSFVQLGSYCEGETPGILNTTSIEGITGTWSPTAITTAVPGTSTYTFSEDVGQCAIGTTMNVTVTSPAPPTFTQIEPICINGVAPALLGTSDNGVAGTWNPSVINTAIAGTNTYTFTPEAGLCAISATMDIVIEPAVQSSFTQLGTYCEGETPDILNTTSIEGITGTWSPTAINTAAPGTSAYTFSIDVGQCALGTSMNISISAPIVTAFTQVDPICINGTAPILSGTSDNGITGSWTPSTVNTATIGTGIYTFTPDPGICATSASMDIVIDPATQASFTQLGPYCQGETSGVLTNTSIEGITGTWSPTAITTAIPGTSTYTFSEDLGQCAIGATMNVTITPPETPTFTQIAPICINGGAPALPGTSDNGFTGTWTPSTINTATAGISTYTFTPDAGLCTISATMDITIVELPFVDPGADQIISCITNVGGAQIGSPAVPGNTYSWSPSADLTDANNSNPIANPIGTTTYTVTVTNSSGCISAGQVNVSIDNAPPTIAITNNTATNILTCTVLALNVTASGGLNYSWDSGLGNDAAATITAPGIYTVTGTAPNGCQETESIEVTQDNNIDLFVTLSEPEICSGEEITLTVNSTIATDFDWTVIQNGVTGASAGALPNSGVGAEITQTLQLTSSNNGEVEYIITPTSGGCIGESQSVTVYLLAPIEPQFDALGPFCINETPTSLQMVSNEGVSGTWNPSTISTTLAGTSNYIFTPNPDQCALTQNMDILINELPLVSFSADNLVGCAPHVVNLTSTNGSGTWTVGNGVVLEGTQAQVTLFNPGCYDVTLEIEQDGCANSLTTENYLCVEEAPVADFTATPDVFTDQDVLVSFTNLSIGASSFIWDFGDQNTSAYINPSNLYESTEEGALITLIAVSDFGCTDEAQLIIEYEEQEVFYVPNTFTPDGDNFNQMFTPVFYSGFDPYNFEMLIYNRWGELVFESKNADIGWDGTYGLSGMKASDGAYTWKITYKNPKTDQRKVIVGHVTLIR